MSDLDFEARALQGQDHDHDDGDGDEEEEDADADRSEVEHEHDDAPDVTMNDAGGDGDEAEAAQQEPEETFVGPEIEQLAPAGPYDTREQAEAACKEAARNRQFILVIKSSGPRGVYMGCDRHGKGISRGRGIRNTKSRKANCPFRVIIRRRTIQGLQKWVVTASQEDHKRHNHPLIPRPPPRKKSKARLRAEQEEADRIAAAGRAEREALGEPAANPARPFPTIALLVAAMKADVEQFTAIALTYRKGDFLRAALEKRISDLRFNLSNPKLKSWERAERDLGGSLNITETERAHMHNRIMQRCFQDGDWRTKVMAVWNDD